MPALGEGMTPICSARAHLRQATERLSYPHIKQLAAMNKCLAQSNKPRTRSKATKNLLTLSQHRRRGEPKDAGSNRAKEEINVASLQTTGQHANENRRVGDRRRAWEGRFAACLGRRRRRFGHCLGDHVVAALIRRGAP